MNFFIEVRSFQMMGSLGVRAAASRAEGGRASVAATSIVAENKGRWNEKKAFGVSMGATGKGRVKNSAPQYKDYAKFEN